MKDRVRMVMDHFKLTQKQFANELCVAEATISNIYKGRTMPTNNLIQAVHQAYPGVNINWLMFGEGEMLLPLSGSEQPSTPSAAYLSGEVSNAGYGSNAGFGASDEPSLFSSPSSDASVPASAPGVPVATGAANYRSPQVEMQLVEALTQLKNAKSEEKPVRKIKEIRVFFDDGTFETFAPSSK